MKCEANGCHATLRMELVRAPDGTAAGITMWRVPPGWSVTQVEFEAKDQKPAHRRLVILCPMHGAGLAPREANLTPVPNDNRAFGVNLKAFLAGER